MELPIDDTDQALFTAATKMTVNNRKIARFWTASWIDGSSPALLFLNLYSHSKRKNRTVSEAMTNDQWIRDISHDLTVGLISEFVQLWTTLVEETHFDPSSAAEDTITWTRTASGEYTAKSAYLMQFDGGMSSLYPKMVWHVYGLHQDASFSYGCCFRTGFGQQTDFSRGNGQIHTSVHYATAIWRLRNISSRNVPSQGGSGQRSIPRSVLRIWTRQTGLQRPR